MKDYTKHLISASMPVRDALEQLDRLGKDLTLFVVDNEQKLQGTITDGDLRRGFLKGYTIADNVSKFMFPGFSFLQRNNYHLADLDNLRAKKIKLVPVLDDIKRIIRLINFESKKSILPVDAVIMAGGKGQRLKPLTNSVPKPLLKIGEKPIIEHNIDRLIDFGVGTIFITIKYLGEQITDFFGNGEKKGVSIQYIEENNPLGTIGSVGLINNFDHNTILVMNSDLLTNIDYEDFYRSFVEEEADMTVATIPYNVDIPYAVIEKKGSRITSFTEKPTYTYYSNAGIYLIKKELIGMIPTGEKFNATDFMEILIGQGFKVTHFPILGYWLDIGRMEDYKKAQEDIKRIKF
jgi:dTDP-glucose pyrophosphorylase